MQFDYEITVEEYAAAQVLYYKACAKGQLVRQPLTWGIIGLFFVLMAVLRWDPYGTSFLLLLTGAWLLYGTIAMLFPMRSYRKHYPQAGLAGNKYHAELDSNGLFVNGDGCSWQVPWTGVRIKGEDQRVLTESRPCVWHS
jgi:hypothetical protein